MDGQLGPVTEFFRDYKLEMDLLQDIVDHSNFENPIVRNLDTISVFTFDPRYVVDFSTEIAQLEVVTTSGTLTKEEKVEKGLYMLKRYSVV